jgi:hypothetical protein
MIELTNSRNDSILYIFHNLCKNVSIDLIIAREDVKHCCDDDGYEMMNMISIQCCSYTVLYLVFSLPVCTVQVLTPLQ